MDGSLSKRASIDLTSDNDDLLYRYGQIHIKMAQSIAGSNGIYRSQSVSIFNDSYKEGKDIRDSKSYFTYTVDPKEQHKHPEFGYLHRVLELCSKGNICSKLGLSIKDFMEMDLNTFTYIEDYYTKYMEREHKETKNILSENGIDIDKM